MPPAASSGTAADEQAILALLKSLEDFYADQDQQIDDLRDVRLLRDPVILPDAYKLVQVEVRDPTITDELDRVVPSFTLDEPELTVKAPPNSGQAGEANSTLRERWTKAVLRAASNPGHGMRTLQAAVDACAGDGGGWTKLLFTGSDHWKHRYGLRARDYADDEGYPDQPGAKSGPRKYSEAVEAAKREGGVPFRWIACDARGIYPLIRDGEVVELFEVTERPLFDVCKQYGLGVATVDGEKQLVKGLGDPESESELLHSSTGTTVRFVEYWTKSACVYLVCGAAGGTVRGAQTVRTWRHGYGRVPYFAALGRMVSWWGNRKVGASISQSKLWLVRYLSFLLTLHAQVACRDSLPPMYESIPDGAIPLLGEDGKPIRSEKWQPGEIRIGPPGGNLQVPNFPNSSANLEKHIGMIKSQIDAMDAPKAPANLADADNGFATSLVMSEARIKQDPIGQSIERMLEQVTRFLWHLMRTKVREPVWVEIDDTAAEGWLSAGPDDLGPGVSIRWALSAERPNAQLVEARYWHERVRERTASRHQAIEQMGDNPDEIDEQIAWDEIRASPHYKALLLQRSFEKLNRGDLIRQAAQQMAQTGALPGMGPPGMPGAGMPMGMGQLGGAPPAMGAGGVPDMGNLAISPNGAGAAPMPGSQTNGAVPGVSTMPGPPQQSIAPGIQALGR